jgi:hypothetical protein
VATWNDLQAYIHNYYHVEDEGDDFIKLRFDVGGLRSQVVVVWHRRLSGTNEDWIQIESAIGELGQVDLEKAVKQVGETLVGGLSLLGNLVTFRHAVPLEDLSINEFESPLQLVTTAADQLERDLTGRDRY